MSNNTRITVAQVSTRVDALVATQVETNALLARIVARMDAAEHATPAAVAEVTQITTAPSKRAPRKAAKATASKASTKLPSVTEARKLVDAGGDAWTIKVLSTTTGKAIPFGLVLRAERAAARAATTASTTATTATPKAKRVSKRAQAKAEASKALFGMGGKELTALAAEGDKGAQAEIDRRTAKRTSK